MTIRARNVHDALPEALHQMKAHGIERDTRNGKVLYMPEPVTTMYEKPTERVLFWPERDANPFFHFYEALWMLGGRQDVVSLTRFVARMTNFSDNGTTFHGAYGYRWRVFFGLDQPMIIGKALLTDPNNRRQVLQMWNAPADLVDQTNKRDVPCNLEAIFQINHEHELDMMVTNRSNDIVWGTYGANAVHFSMLQEFVAAVAGVPVGRYWHVSFNWHGYLDTISPVMCLADRAFQPHRVVQWASPYERGNVEPYPIMNTDPETWLGDLDMFLDEEGRAMGYRDRFFRRVALPIVQTHDAFKQAEAPQRYKDALAAAKGIRATDWQLAIVEWIQRRYDKWQTR